MVLTASEKKILEDFRSRAGKRTATQFTKAGVDPRERLRLARASQRRTDALRAQAKSESARQVLIAQLQARESKALAQKIARQKRSAQDRGFVQTTTGSGRSVSVSQSTAIKLAERIRASEQRKVIAQQQKGQQTVQQISQPVPAVTRTKKPSRFGQTTKTKTLGTAISKVSRSSFLPSIPEATAQEFPRVGVSQDVPRERDFIPFQRDTQPIKRFDPTESGRFFILNPKPEKVLERFPDGSPKLIQPAQLVDEFEIIPADPVQQQKSSPRKGFTGIIPAIQQGEFETEFGQRKSGVAVGKTLEGVDLVRQSDDFLEGFASPFVETGIAVKDVAGFIASEDRDNFRGTDIETPSFVTDLFGVAIAQGQQALGGERADVSQTFEAFGERQTEKSLGRIIGETTGEIILTVGTLGIGKAVQLGAKGSLAGIKTAQAVARSSKTVINFTKLPKVKVPKVKSKLQKQVNAHNKQIDEAEKLLNKAQKLETKAGAKVTQKQADEIRRLRIKGETLNGKLLGEQYGRFSGLVKFGGKGLKVIDEKEAIVFTGKKVKLPTGIGKLLGDTKGKGGGIKGGKGKGSGDDFFGGRTVKTGKVNSKSNLSAKFKKDEEALDKLAKQGGGQGGSGVSGKSQQLLTKTKVKTKVKTSTQAQKQKSALDNLFVKPKTKLKKKTKQRVVVEEQFVRITKTKPRATRTTQLTRVGTRQKLKTQVIPRTIVRPVIDVFPRQTTRITNIFEPIVRPVVTVKPPKTRKKQDQQFFPVIRPQVELAKPKPELVQDRPDIVPVRPRPVLRSLPLIITPQQQDPFRRQKQTKPRKKSKQGRRLFDVAETPFGQVEVGLGFFIEQKGDESIAEAIGTAPKNGKKKKKEAPIDNIFDPSGLF